MGRIVKLVLALLVAAAASGAGGRWAQSPLKPWFESLRNRDGQSCCGDADGRRLEDPEWEHAGSGFRVKIAGAWHEVPPRAVLAVPNRAGAAMVWAWRNGDELKIVCFLPGASG